MQRAADGAPRNPRVRYNLGLLQQSLGRDAEAEATLRAAVELAPDQPDYLYALADHHLKRGRLEQALAVAERLIAVRPDLEVGRQLKDYLEAELAKAGRP